MEIPELHVIGIVGGSDHKHHLMAHTLAAAYAEVGEVFVVTSFKTLKRLVMMNKVGRLKPELLDKVATTMSEENESYWALAMAEVLTSLILSGYKNMIITNITKFHEHLFVLNSVGGEVIYVGGGSASYDPEDLDSQIVEFVTLEDCVRVARDLVSTLIFTGMVEMIDDEGEGLSESMKSKLSDTLDNDDCMFG